MKRTLLFLSFLTSVAYAQDCSKLFISEYVEGWSNNKALEIYNPTSQPINLSQYFIARYSNGSNSATVKNSVQLSGTIAPYSVHVAVLDKRNPAGTGQEAPIWDSLEARGDGFYSAVYNTSDAFYWNGNDAILLAKGNITGLSSSTQISPANISGMEILDIFGRIGENPANASGVSSGNDGAWSTTAPYSTGQGVLITQDHSMIRKPNVLKGVNTQVTTFNGLAQYDTIPAVTFLFDGNGDTIKSNAGNPIRFGNWFSLGEHTCNCDPTLSTKSLKQAEVSVYPNPVTEGVVYVKGAVNVTEVQVINALGQVVGKARNSSASPQMAISMVSEKGVYILRIIQADGNVTSKRVVVK